MTAVLLGLFAALCWSLHDMLARLQATHLGAFRMAFLVLAAGVILLLLPVGLRADGQMPDGHGLLLALAMGVSYAVALGGLFKALSLAPVSVVGPLTSAYPGLVVLWGVVNGLSPTVMQWAAVAIILAGVYAVSAYGPNDGGFAIVKRADIPMVVLACTATSIGFSAALVLGQEATLSLGGMETTLASRFPAALLLLPLAFKDHQKTERISIGGWLAVMAMAALDVLAVSGINYAGHFPNKEFASLAIATYGAGSVLLARLFLKESVSAGQWAGIGLLAIGVGYLGLAGA